MTRKDYIKIADAISNSHSFEHEGLDTSKLIGNLCELFYEDNIILILENSFKLVR